MSNQIDLPDDPDLAKSVLDSRAAERGMLGKFFGTREHAPTNIAAVVLLLLFVLLGILIMSDLPSDLDRASLITAALSTISLVLGFLFGRNVS